MAEKSTISEEVELPYDKIGELLRRLDCAGAAVPRRFSSNSEAQDIDPKVVSARTELHEKIEWVFSLTAAVKDFSNKHAQMTQQKDCSSVETKLDGVIKVLGGNEDLEEKISLNMNMESFTGIKSVVEPMAVLKAMLEAVRSIRLETRLIPTLAKESLSDTPQARLFNGLAKVYEEAFDQADGAAAASITRTYDNHQGPFVVFVRFCLEKYGDPLAYPMTPAALTKALKRSVLKRKNSK